ncbi:(Fe-S)-binding protein [Solitalea koreensis]|uniref:L-lactate dehydrogenase complex protein LldE n=1 Tax=Solitalea koreensis TaxID=543615 RepID=A0A521BJQ7_9SPHI|nr:(Fe-S)-binding protein [Solitalea koreensis]SMO46900.1 L-lactate dehydrogenase complex protein LldE [Solitalea koreensis]
MKIALFVPCYVDQFYPNVGIATLQLLEKLGVEVDFPMEQTCCGQPMANTGFEKDSIPVYNHFVKTFTGYDYIVTPSGSCAYHVKKHYNIIEQTTAVKEVRSKTIELVSFITDVLKVKELPVTFPYKVGLHVSCHGQRGLKNATASEITPDHDGLVLSLLKNIKGIDLTVLNRNDECCGFGGSFCVSEEAVSAKMGIDRVNDHVKNGTQVLTGADMSCLMHLEGIVRREKLAMKVMHIAEILNGNKV